MWLFPPENNWPPGFSYQDDFIDEGEETGLLQFISSLDFKAFVFQGYEAKRKVISYGLDYSFNNRSISPGAPIPEVLKPLVSKVADHLKLDEKLFAEALVTEYPPGSVINWHRDAPPFGLIAGISLATDCKFRLRPYDKKNRKRSDTISFTAKRRSLYVMQGEARESWEHSIAPVVDTRYSVTLRTMREK